MPFSHTAQRSVSYPPVFSTDGFGDIRFFRLDQISIWLSLQLGFKITPERVILETVASSDALCIQIFTEIKGNSDHRFDGEDTPRVIEMICKTLGSDEIFIPAPRIVVTWPHLFTP